VQGDKAARLKKELHSVSTVNKRLATAALPHDSMTATRSIDTHVQAEYGNQVPVIMPTVSTWDVHFALLGPTAKDLLLATTTAEALEYYEGTRRDWTIITSHHLKEVSTAWYSLHDSVGEIRLLANGEKVVSRTVILFPAWTDGIIGEIVWGQPEWAAKDTRPVTESELQVSDLHHRFVDSWERNDVAGQLELIEDETCTVLRVVEVDGDHRSRLLARSKEELGKALSAPEAGKVLNLERSNLVITPWYAFGGYRVELQLPDRRVEREMAILYPVGPNGRFVGQLGYGIEVTI
jgi:hypothetical protein